MHQKTGISLIAIGLVLVSGIVLAVKYEDWIEIPADIKERQGFASQQMRDPASTQFKSEKLTKDGWLCGDMNAKNAYGAYTGFKRFMARAYDDAWIDGYGYAGKETHIPTQRIMDELSAKITILKAQNALREQGIVKDPLTEDQVSEQVVKHLFEQRWEKHCS